MKYHIKYLTLLFCIIISVTLAAGDRTANDHLKALKILRDSVSFYQDKSPAEALPFYNRILNTYLDEDELGFEAAYGTSVYYFYTMSILDSTLKYSNKALEIALSLNDSVKIAQIYNVLANVHLQQNNFDEALSLFTRASKIFERLDYPESLAKILLNTGSVYSYKGDFLKAIEYYNRTRNIYRSLNDTEGEIACLNNLVVIYVQFNQYNKAKDFQKDIYNNFINSESIVKIITGTTNMGVVHFYLEEYDSALIYFNKVLELSREYNNNYMYANVLNNIAETNIKLGKLSEAREQARESYEMCVELNDIYGQASALKNLGQIYFLGNNHTLAGSYLEKSLPLARKANAISELEDILSALTTIYEHREDYKKAYQTHKEYISIHESTNQEETLFRLEEMQLQYEHERNKAELLERMAVTRREKQIRNMLLVIVLFLMILITTLAVANRSRKVYLKTLKNKNDIIKKDHELLVRHQDHLSMINKILRHDLANNNTAVISAVKLYNRKNDRQYLDAITKKAESSLELIDRMKQLENITASHSVLKAMNLRNVLHRIFLQYPMIEFSIQGQGNVIADEALHSVFDNITHNALIHGEADKIDVTIGSCTDNGFNMIEIRFANNGSNIPDDIKDKIFTEHFSYGPKAQTGLGLYIVKKNIERYSGKIRVENNPSGGVSMIIHLPSAESE